MAESAAAAAARTLAELAPRLGRLIAGALERDAGIRLSLRQYRLLQRLAERPHRTTDLASSADVSQPTASAAVTSLESRGLVSREPDPDDRRATLILLTAEGRTLLATARHCVLERLMLVTRDMTPEQAEALQALAPVIVEGLDRARDAKRRGRSARPGAERR